MKQIKITFTGKAYEDFHCLSRKRGETHVETLQSALKLLRTLVDFTDESRLLTLSTRRGRYVMIV